MTEQKKTVFREITALRAIGMLHKTQVHLETYASRCAICKTPVPCDTQRLVLDALSQAFVSAVCMNAHKYVDGIMQPCSECGS